MKYRLVRCTFRFVIPRLVYRYPQYFVFLQNIFKTSSTHVFKTSPRYVFKTSSRNVFKTSSRNVFKTSSRHVFKKSSRHVFKTNKCLLGKYSKHFSSPTPIFGTQQKFFKYLFIPQPRLKLYILTD